MQTILRYFIILLIFISSLSLTSTAVFASKIVYIYAGPGVSKNSLEQTEKTINFFLNAYYEIKQISPEQIIHENWEKETALFIIPGGADIPYTIALNGLGNQKIKSYVENGGAFLGLCAGGYYGGDFVDFAKNTELEVQGKRELAFFPGIVKGPILATYDYQSEKGARAAHIIWNDPFTFKENPIFSVYYNGGGYFVDANQKDNIRVLACYDIGEEFPAIIECEVGSGKAILSGVHFEYDPELLDFNNDDLKPIIRDIKNQNDHRLELVKYLLKRLNLLREEGCFAPNEKYFADHKYF